MRAAVRRLLRRYGFPREDQDRATLTVIEQAEQLELGLAA